MPSKKFNNVYNMKQKNNKDRTVGLVHGGYKAELGTKKKTGLTSQQIKDFFKDKSGTLIFMGVNRQRRRSKNTLPARPSI